MGFKFYFDSVRWQFRLIDRFFSKRTIYGLGSLLLKFILNICLIDTGRKFFPQRFQIRGPFAREDLVYCKLQISSRRALKGRRAKETMIYKNNLEYKFHDTVTLKGLWKIETHKNCKEVIRGDN
jgi:hypothetical protein